MIPFLINPALRLRPAKDYTGAHKTVGLVRAHKRRVNPKKKARRKLSAGAKLAHRSKRAAKRSRRRFSAAQLASQRRFTLMVQQQARTRQARRPAAAGNPTRRTGGSMAPRKKKSRRSAASKRRHSSNPRRKGRRRNRPGVSLAKRRRHSVNPHKGRVRHRRNPSFGARTILKDLAQGAGNGVAVLVGGAASRFVASKVPVGQTSAIGRGVTQIVVGIVLGKVTEKVTKSPRLGAMVTAGAFADVFRQNAGTIPVVGRLLSGFGVYPTYAPLPGNRVGEYVRAIPLSGWGAPDIPANEYIESADSRMVASVRQNAGLLA